MSIENLNISPELREKARARKSTAELLALAKKEDLRLSEEELAAVAGGNWVTDCNCVGFF